MHSRVRRAGELMQPRCSQDAADGGDAESWDDPRNRYDWLTKLVLVCRGLKQARAGELGAK